MSQNEGPGYPLPKTKRLEVIREGRRAGKTQEEMARLCGVSRKTITRDLKEWRDSGGFDEWLDEEYHELHQVVKAQDPKMAYREVSQLKARTMKQRLEAEVSGVSPIIVRMYDPLQDPARKDAEAAAARNDNKDQPPPKAA